MEYKTLLLNAGIKPTNQRIKILEYLIHNKSHPTVNDIFNVLKLNNEFLVSLPTVYNTINLFVKKKIISEIVTYTDSNKHYDFIESPHSHLVCKKCNQIFDISYPSFTADLQHLSEAANRKHFDVDDTSITVYGICNKCQKIKSSNDN